MYFCINVNSENCVYEWKSKYLFMTFTWLSYELNDWEMKMLLKKILRFCWWDGVWDWLKILEVFFTGSEELFSPFLVGTLPDFL